MGKYSIIVTAICLILLSCALFAIIFYGPIKEADNEQNNNNLPADNINKPATAFGVKMQYKCLAGFNDFIKKYGEDYSKCMVAFNSNDEYCGGFDPDTQGLSDANVIVILDASGSMAGKIGQDVKIDIAKKAVSDFMTKMPKSVNTGLIVYGQKGSSLFADKSLSCQGTEEVVKLGRNNSNNIITAMNSFYPKGWTPIAGSLNFAKDIFSKKGKNDKNYLILVSDGIETCDGDPLVAAEGLKSEIPGIQLSVIGFATDGNASNLLSQIADMGGGSYLSANNSSDIARAFNDELLLIKRDCISVSLLEVSSKYKTNNLNNLNCWLAADEKESYNFTTNLEKKSVDTECNIEISQALVARQTQFWYQKQDLEEKNNVIYNKIESDLNNQLEVLGN